MTYRIVRMFFSGRKYTVRRGLTIEQARAHCASPEASSQTATSKTAKDRTRLRGEWFDGFNQE